VRAPLRYIGGKYYQTKWILKHFPVHQIYVEPFCGSAAVFFAKAPRPVYAKATYTEVLNDIDGRIINFFKKLKEDPESLIYEQFLVPYSQQIFYDSSDYSKEMQTLILNKMGWGGKLNSKSFTYSKETMGSTRAKTWKQLPNLLFKTANRLKDAIIFNESYEKIIERFDTEYTLFYVDPPYPEFSYYKFNFKEEDHLKLAEILNNVIGKVVMSYNLTEEIKGLYSSWNYKEKEFKKNCNRTKRGIKHEKFKETLLWNFG